MTENTQAQEAINLLLSMRGFSQTEREARITCIRSLAERARESTAVYTLFDRMLLVLAEAHTLPLDTLHTFRAYYMTRDKRPAPRALTRELYTNIGTIHKRNRRVLEALLPLFFGVDAVPLAVEIDTTLLNDTMHKSKE